MGHLCKGTQVFKDPNAFRIYRIDGSFLANLDKPLVPRHHPNYHGDPPPKGKPNNPTHSVIPYDDPEVLEVRVKLQNHAQRVDVDQAVVEEIGSLLQR